MPSSSTRSGTQGRGDAAPALPQPASRASGAVRRRLFGNLVPWLFVAPGLIAVTVWLVVPLLSALVLSLHEWSIVPGAENPFVGIEQYGRMAADPVLHGAVTNTAAYAVVTVVGQLLLGLAVALGLETLRRGRVVLRTLYFLPVVTSWVVSALLFQYLFNSSAAGVVNHLLVNVVGVADRPVPWLNEASTAFVGIFALGIWKGVGFAMILFVAALQAIPDELYSAASIDGAGPARAIVSVTLPLLAPTIAMVAVLLTIGAFQVYVPVALMTGGGPLHRTEVVLTYMYDVAFRGLDFGYSSAISFALAGVVFLISQVQLRFMARSALAG